MRNAEAKKQDEDENDKPEVVVADKEEADADADADEKPAVKADKKEKGAPRESKVMQELRNNEDKNLKEWLEEISPSGAIRVKVTRNNPKVWKGLNVGGSLATYDQQIDEDFIRDHHGGGDFYLVVQRPKSNGPGWQYAGGRVVRIAGDPRTDDVFRDKAGEQQAAGGQAPTAIVDRVVSSLERQLDKAQQQQGNAHHGPDTETMRLVMGPMQAQIDQMSQMLREKDRQLMSASAPRPVERDEFRDRMLATMMEGDSARMVSLRTQHESEIRQLKQSAIDNEGRLRDSFERDKQQMSYAHERELNALRSAYDLKVAAQEQSHSTTRTLLEAEVRRLQADLTEAKSELTALRLKKDKSPMEMLRDARDLQELVGDLGGDKEDKSTFDRIADAAPAFMQHLASRFSADPAQQQQQQQQPPPPPPPPQAIVRQPPLFTGPNGGLFRRGPRGEMIPVPVGRPRQQQAAQPGEPQQAPMPDIAPATVKVAVDFLETAFRNEQDPIDVATSVRSMIPTEILTVIRDRGVDGFLADVAKIEGTSPLASQAGRNWSRKLGKSLLGQ